MAFDLKDFLEQARAEGTNDSEGHFTVQHEKALKKLAFFALPKPYDWVLKIVQAANQWRCPHLIVQQSREATSFFFSPPSSNFPPDGAFVQSLKSGTYDGAGPVDTLCLALRALVDQVELSFVFASCRNGVMGEPGYAGEDMSKLGDRGRRAWASVNKDGFRLTVSHFLGKESITGRYFPSFTAQDRRDLTIAELLAAAAYSSSTDIYLDGLKVSDVCLQPKIGSTSIFRPCSFGVLATSPEGKPEAKLYPLDPRLPKSRLTAPLKTDFSASSFYLRTGDWLNLPQLKSPVGPTPLNHQILWVRHGVVVKRQQLANSTLASTLLVFRNSDQLRTDIGGLSVGVTEEDQQLTNLYLQLISSSLERLPTLLSRVLDESTSDRLRPRTEVPDFESKPPHLSTMEDASPSLLKTTFDWDLRAAASFSKSLLESSRRAFLVGRTGHRLREWVEFLEAEMARLTRDLRRTPRPLRSSQFLVDGF